MMRAVLFWPLLVILALPAFADSRMTQLVEGLKLREGAEILRREGLAYAEELDGEMLNGQGGAAFQIQVAAIYDPDRMVEAVRAALEAEVDGENLDDANAFFSSLLGVGRKIVTLENSARQAMAQQDVEDAARARYEALRDTDDARLDQIQRLIASGDMLNRNVTSALNSNYQFMRGLADRGALDMSDDEILAEVSTDVEDITEDTSAWLHGFFLLAYHPLTDAELEEYIAFAETSAGQAVNRALFDGFGSAYESISYALGQAVALNMTEEEL